MCVINAATSARLILITSAVNTARAGAIAIGCFRNKRYWIRQRGDGNEASPTNIFFSADYLGKTFGRENKQKRMVSALFQRVLSPRSGNTPKTQESGDNT